MACMNGPRSYMKNLFVGRNLVASIILLTCIVVSLYFAFWERAYLMSLLMAVIEANVACQQEL